MGLEGVIEPGDGNPHVDVTQEHHLAANVAGCQVAHHLGQSLDAVGEHDGHRESFSLDKKNYK